MTTTYRVYTIGPPEQPLADFKLVGDTLEPTYYSEGFKAEVMTRGLVLDIDSGKELTPDDGPKFIEVLKRTFRSSITTAVKTI